jgi:flagellar biosynthesis anti-sigma factor FlgM
MVFAYRTPVRPQLRRCPIPRPLQRPAPHKAPPRPPIPPSARLDTQDTASISAAPSQLSGDLPIRQDRVDALRAQIDSGTYTVDPRAVANAMFQNLFRS